MKEMNIFDLFAAIGDPSKPINIINKTDFMWWNDFFAYIFTGFVAAVFYFCFELLKNSILRKKENNNIFINEMVHEIIKIYKILKISVNITSIMEKPTPHISNKELIDKLHINFDYTKLDKNVLLKAYNFRLKNQYKGNSCKNIPSVPESLIKDCLDLEDKLDKAILELISDNPRKDIILKTNKEVLLIHITNIHTTYCNILEDLGFNYHIFVKDNPYLKNIKDLNILNKKETS